MKLTISKSDLVKALLESNHAGASEYNCKYKVAMKDGKARVIWADTPSSLGGYTSNYVGEKNVSPDEFLDYERNDFSWSEDDEVDEVRDFISSNLLRVVNGIKVEYK